MAIFVLTSVYTRKSFLSCLIFLYHLLYFISYLIAAYVLIPAWFLNKLIHFCRINKIIIIIIIIIIINIWW